MKTNFFIKFCFLLALSVVAFSSNPKNNWNPHSQWPLTPHLGRLPSPSKIKQELSGITEEEVWEEVSLALKNLKSIRRNSSAILAIIKRDLEMIRSAKLQSRVNEICLESVMNMTQDKETKFYARRMWDSWGTPEGGIWEGNTRWPGHYYECKIAENDQFSGKWCLSYYGLIFKKIQHAIPFDLTLGICFPSSCTEEEISYIYQNYFVEYDFPPLLQVECPAEPKWRSIDYVCSVVIGIIMIFIIAGTTYDLIERYKNNSEKSTFTIQKKLMMCFSVIKNTEQIIGMKKKPGDLPALDGIRVITCTWVILGHLLQLLFYTMDNAVFAKRQILKDPAYMTVINPFYSVDTFFFLSGLLVTYLGLKHLDKSKGFLNVPMMYLQRYLRLTPVYAFAILFHMSLYKFLGDGPGWSHFTEANYNSCKNDWWTNLLYINDFYPLTNNCYEVAWYLANDMQMFLLSPIFILLLYHFRIVGILSSFGVVMFSTIYNGVVSFYHDIQPTVIYILLPLSYFYRWIIANGSSRTYENVWLTDLYFMPWARIHAYMIGMLTGYFLYVRKGKIKLHKAVILVGWILAAGSALAVIYGPYPYVKDMELLPNDLSALYNAMSRPVFVTAVAWVVIVCAAGYGGPVTKFLDWKVFKPLSRLSYTTYIVHIYIVYYYGSTQEKPIHFLTINYIFVFLSSVALSFGCGFLLSVFVEWPFVGICKILFFPTASNTKKKTDFPLSGNDHESKSKWTPSGVDQFDDGNQASLKKKETKTDFINESFDSNGSTSIENTEF